LVLFPIDESFNSIIFNSIIFNSTIFNHLSSVPSAYGRDAKAGGS
jgi:hypothetical protein